MDPWRWRGAGPFLFLSPSCQSHEPRILPSGHGSGCASHPEGQHPGPMGYRPQVGTSAFASKKSFHHHIRPVLSRWNGKRQDQRVPWTCAHWHGSFTIDWVPWFQVRFCRTAVSFSDNPVSRYCHTNEVTVGRKEKSIPRIYVNPEQDDLLTIPGGGFQCNLLASELAKKALADPVRLVT